MLHDIPNQTFIDLKFLKVRDLIKFYQLRLIYDFQTTTLPTDLMSMFRLSCEVRTETQNLNSIHNKLLYIPPFRTTSYGKQSLTYLGPKLWNEIFKTSSIQVNVDRKKDIKTSKIKTIYSFKNAMKKHFLFKYA